MLVELGLGDDAPELGACRPAVEQVGHRAGLSGVDDGEEGDQLEVVEPGDGLGERGGLAAGEEAVDVRSSLTSIIERMAAVSRSE